MHDPVNHPDHYTRYRREVIELTERLDFCVGNAVKYILRAPFKDNFVQDMEKALWYIDRSVRHPVDITLDVRRVAKEFENPIVDELLACYSKEFTQKEVKRLLEVPRSMIRQQIVDFRLKQSELRLAELQERIKTVEQGTEKDDCLDKIPYRLFDSWYATPGSDDFLCRFKLDRDGIISTMVPTDPL